MIEGDLRGHNFTNRQVNQLLNLMFNLYGYDFRHYSRVHIERRIAYVILKEDLGDIKALSQKISTSEAFFKHVLPDFSIHVTEMFRDPDVFAYIRRTILPRMSERQQIKIWHAGCASGEEVYSLAIMLKELGLDHKSSILATDFDSVVLKKAQQGIYLKSLMERNKENYQVSGGRFDLSDYYKVHYDAVVMDGSLKRNIEFRQHNLVDGELMDQMDLILCRNVLIYFNRALQSRVLSLLDGSLKTNGVLCLGSKETLDYASVRNHYKSLDEGFKLYFKKSSEQDESRKRGDPWTTKNK